VVAALRVALDVYMGIFIVSPVEAVKLCSATRISCLNDVVIAWVMANL
jgi:hypothetical protein